MRAPNQPKDSVSLSKKLLGFATALLQARETVQMTMGQSRLGVFQESEVAALPGVSVDPGDGAWLRVKRLP